MVFPVLIGEVSLALFQEAAEESLAAEAGGSLVVVVGWEALAGVR